jgi:hypothetical protein
MAVFGDTPSGAADTLHWQGCGGQRGDVPGEGEPDRAQTLCERAVAAKLSWRGGPPPQLLHQAGAAHGFPETRASTDLPSPASNRSSRLTRAGRYKGGANRHVTHRSRRPFVRTAMRRFEPSLCDLLTPNGDNVAQRRLLSEKGFSGDSQQPPQYWPINAV